MVQTPIRGEVHMVAIAEVAVVEVVIESMIHTGAKVTAGQLGEASMRYN